MPSARWRQASPATLRSGISSNPPSWSIASARIRSTTGFGEDFDRGHPPGPRATCRLAEHPSRATYHRAQLPECGVVLLDKLIQQRGLRSMTRVARRIDETRGARSISSWWSSSPEPAFPRSSFQSPGSIERSHRGRAPVSAALRPCSRRGAVRRVVPHEWP